MLHSIEVFLPVVQVVLEGPVTVVTEVPFPHLSLGKTASACPGITRQLLGAQPWEWKIQDLQRLLPKEENSNHLGLAARERGETQQFISLSITDCWGRICCLCMREKAWICIYLCHPKQQQLCWKDSPSPSSDHMKQRAKGSREGAAQTIQGANRRSWRSWAPLTTTSTS